MGAVDVLIVGAGPAGLTLGIDLLRRGIAVRLIDRLECPVMASKGKGLQPRTLEVFEDLGVLPDILAAGQIYPAIRVYRGRTVLHERRMTEVREATDATPYPNAYLLSQGLTEGFLHKRVAALGGTIERPVELKALEQSSDHVVATLQGPDGEEELVARYMIGADGGHSAVRRLTGIPLDGESPALDGMLVADVEVTDIDRDYWHMWATNMSDRVALCPMPSTNHFQFMVSVPHGETPELTLEFIQQALASRSGRDDLKVSNLSWISHFRPNVRMAERFREGRVFLVGDAAHVHPPTGGQGLNTSVQDSYNLGWKLAAVLHGAPETLLATYEEERVPVAAFVLGRSEKLLRMGQNGEEGALRRGDDEQQLLLNYVGASLAPPNTVESTLSAGSRLPDARLCGRDGTVRRLFSLTQGGHFTALTTENEDFVGANTVFLPAYDTCGSVAKSLGTTGTFSAVIRPDGYIGGIFAMATDARAYLAQFTKR